MKGLLYLFCVLTVMLTGCSGRPEDPRLLDIAGKVSDSPEEMLARLDSIDVGSMKESDRWFHALMRIKAQDKAYVRHTSDSVILGVMDYYSGHRRSGLYPEALYYGGRVYSDLGDAPNALRYFQDALDAIPEGEDNGFRATVLSQTGFLLNSLRLHSEAVRYLREAIALSKMSSDTLKKMRNLQLLGAIYMHLKDSYRSDSCFMEARSLGLAISHPDTIIHDMYFAVNELNRGNVEGALGRIRPVLTVRSDNRRDIAYAYAAQIYLEAGILDSACLYAVKLLNSNNLDYKKNGYGMLLSPKLRQFSHPDSLLSYASAHEEILDAYLDRHNARQATIQTSLYNYQSHERARKKAEESKTLYMYVADGAVFLLLVLCIIIMYLRNKSMKTLLQYRKALDDIALLKETLLDGSEVNAQAQENTLEDVHRPERPMETKSNDGGEALVSDENLVSDEDKEKDILRERLKEELLALQKAGQAKTEVPESIISSLAYGKLREYITAEKMIIDSDCLWSELEEEVMKVSPGFKSGLYLLAGDRLKEDAYHMALLVKCGVTPTELAVLVGRSKGAVSSRRGYICETIFGQKLGAKVMDDIIRLL